MTILCVSAADDMYNQYRSRIRRTEIELSRLEQYPELFPSKEVREQFWLHVHELSTTLVRGMNAATGHTQAQHALSDSGAEYYRARVLPTRDSSRNMWQQFLHNRAPGGGLEPTEVASEGSTQLLPPASYRLLTAMIEENKATIEAILAVSDGKICILIHLDPSDHC